MEGHMTTIFTFTNIKAWQHAHAYVIKVYELTHTFPKHEQYALTSQIQRAAVSIPANIAEGFSRRTQKDRLRFYEISEGSLEETKYYIILAQDLQYISKDNARALYAQANDVGRLLKGWIKNTK